MYGPQGTSLHPAKPYCDIWAILGRPVAYNRFSDSRRSKPEGALYPNLVLLRTLALSILSCSLIMARVSIAQRLSISPLSSSVRMIQHAPAICSHTSSIKIGRPLNFPRAPTLPDISWRQGLGKVSTGRLSGILALLVACGCPVPTVRCWYT
jgi:hypothetical protein